jgi:hypothetical protein
MNVFKPLVCFQGNYQWTKDSRLPTESFTGSGSATQIGFMPSNTLNTYNQNPNWREQVAKNVDASTVYRREEVWARAVRARGSNLFTGAGFTQTRRGYTAAFGTFPNLALVEDDTLRDQALAKVKGKLRQQVGSAKLLAPTAELRELRGLVNQAVGYTWKFMQQVRKIKKGGPREILRQASDLYLGYNFGIAPMVGDINNAIEAVDRFLQYNSKPMHFRGKAEKDWVSGYASDQNTFLQGHALALRGRLHHRLSYRYIACHDFIVKAANCYSFSDHLGLNLESVVPTLWELTAFSWVADYFGTVGDFLEDLFYTPPGNTTYVVLNKRYEVNATIDSFPLNTGGSSYTLTGFSSMPGSLKYVLFTRTPLSSLPVRSLRFKTIDEIGSYGLSKLLNLTAILTK